MQVFLPLMIEAAIVAYSAGWPALAGGGSF
jgi:hypothetical protein